MKYLQIIILIALQHQLVFAFQDIYEPDSAIQQILCISIMINVNNILCIV
jgi:hypothetical protein